MSGFCCKSLCLDNKVRIENVEDERDELENRCRLSRRYINYLENVIHNTPEINSSALPLNIVDASVDVENINNAVVNDDISPSSTLSSTNLPNARIIRD